MKKYIKSIIVVSILLFLILLTFIYKEDITNFINDLDSLKSYILSFGVLAPIAMIVLNIIQTVLAPIPGLPIIIAAGYIFGFLPGVIYSLIGGVIGAYIAFKIGEKFGKPFLIKIFGRDKIEKLDNFPQKKKLLFLFIIFLIPLLPDDIIILLSGASNIKLKSFMTVLVLGRLPSIIIYSLIGAGIAERNLALIAISVGAFSLSLVLVYLFKRKIEKKLRELT